MLQVAQPGLVRQGADKVPVLHITRNRPMPEVLLVNAHVHTSLPHVQTL